MLISVTSCNVNAADSDQTTPLVMAALQGNAVICETLVRVYPTSIYLRCPSTSIYLPSSLSSIFYVRHLLLVLSSFSIVSMNLNTVVPFRFEFCSLPVAYVKINFINWLGLASVGLSSYLT